MKICIIGSGYVGLVTGICFASNDKHDVVFCDTNIKKIESLKKNKIDIYEKDLSKRFQSAKKIKKINFSIDLSESINNSKVIFVTVGTPINKKGNIDLSQIEEVTHQIAYILKTSQSYKVIIYKSTIPPGTISNYCLPIIENITKKKNGVDFGLASNPEFLREGSAVYDFENPKKIVIGSNDKKTKKIILSIYKNYLSNNKIINVSIETSEMIKYFSNSFFALLISFGNQLGNFCEKINVDFMEVLEAVGWDNRFLTQKKNKKPEFLNYLIPGIGYGGSCFPKDIKTLIQTGKKNNTNLSILQEVDKVNEKQSKIITKKILQILKDNKKIKKILILGATFKENTDDLRNSTSIDLINSLSNKNLDVTIYDPILMKTNYDKKKSFFHSKVKFLYNLKDIKKYNMIVVNNRSLEFRKLLNDYKNKNNVFLFDSRRFFNKKKFKNYGGSGV